MKKLDPELVARLKAAGISCCEVCGKPIIRMVKQPAGRTGKFHTVWSPAVYCSRSCESKAYRARRKAKRIPKNLPKRTTR